MIPASGVPFSGMRCSARQRRGNFPTACEPMMSARNVADICSAFSASDQSPRFGFHSRSYMPSNRGSGAVRVGRIPARDQSGAAVVMALLVVAFAALIVSGTFQRQSVIARTVENHSAAAQTYWLMAGAVDWMRVILREDGRASTTDHLAEPWAVPLEQTRLNDDDYDPAWLSGAVKDGQADINLRNLVGIDGPVDSEVAVLERLLSVAGLDETLAGPLAEVVDRALSTRSDDHKALPANIDEFAFDDPKLRETLERLRAFVTILPVPTPVNANTASAEVLAARFENVSLVDARRLVASRDRAAFKDLTDVLTRLPDLRPDAPAGQVAVATRFFILEGAIEFRRARLHQRVLLRRQSGQVEVIWKREVQV
jgi:general secretion pathway protein K